MRWFGFLARRRRAAEGQKARRRRRITDDYTRHRPARRTRRRGYWRPSPGSGKHRPVWFSRCGMFWKVLVCFGSLLHFRHVMVRSAKCPLIGHSCTCRCHQGVQMRRGRVKDESHRCDPPVAACRRLLAAKTLGFRDVLPSPFRADIAEVADVGTDAALLSLSEGADDDVQIAADAQ